MKTPSAKRCLLALATAAAFSPVCAMAATITVGSTDDVFNSPTCNLRNAINSIRTALAKGACAPIGAFGDNDTIVFAAALANSTITLARGELVLSGALTITGSGQTIDADYGSRVIYLQGASLTASDLTLTHGYTSATGREGAGAGIYIYGGGATLTRVTITANIAAGTGAGIHASGATVALVHSQVTGNASSGGTGGISAYLGSLQITDSVISGNSAPFTGGVSIYAAYYTSGASATITRSSIADNSAVCTSYRCVGGIYVGYDTYLAATDITVSGNTASGALDHVAGGLYTYGAEMRVVNATIAQNTASGNNYVAGGLWVSYTQSGTATFINSTISANSATTYNASTNVYSGMTVGFRYFTSAVLRNSILAGNAAGTDLGVEGTSLQMDFCVAGTSADVLPFSTNPNNHFTDAPGLGPLQDNGGGTLTMAPLAGSIAIDGGNNAFATSNYDQRGAGFPRVFNVTIDIGAVEYQGDRIFAYGFEPEP